MMDRPLDLRPGAHVRYLPVHTDEWLDGILVRHSPNDEEWLVRNRLGRFWVPVTRLRPLVGPPPESQ